MDKLRKGKIKNNNKKKKKKNNMEIKFLFTTPDHNDSLSSTCIPKNYRCLQISRNNSDFFFTTP